MELQQQPALKTANNQQASADKTPGSSPLDIADNKQSPPFKDQLNQQIDQSNASIEQEKSEINQQDNIIRSNQLETSDTAQEAADTVLDQASGLTQASNEAVPGISLSMEPASDFLAATESALSLIDTAEALPEAGNSLPLLSHALQAIKVPVQFRESMKAQQATTRLDTRIQAGEPLLVSKQTSVSPEVAELLVTKQAVKSSADTTVQIVDPAIVKTTGISEKVVVQNSHFSSLMDEMPATDIIAQTSRLQQVPLTTALNAGLAASQNVNASVNSIASDVNSLLNLTPTPVNSLSSSIAANINSPQWSQQMTEQVSFMLKGGIQQAEIKLNPAHLGPMEIKLSVNDDKASINFVAQHAPVRDLLDAAIPRLREMLEEQGLSLSDVDVSTQSEQQQASEDSELLDNTQDASENSSDQFADNKDSQVLNVDLSSNSGVSIYA